VIRRRTLGGFAVATQHGISITDDDFTEFREVARVANDPAVRTNDGGCDALGGFVIGTMNYDARPGAGSVYRVGHDHRVTTLLSGVSISNGIQWSADGSLAYYIDSPTRRVEVFHVDQFTGEWSDPKPHISIEHPTAVPDGMAIDVEGGLWVALWGAGAVNHYNSAGRLVETVTVPGVTQVSSCTFGGSHRDVLFITTSRQDLMPGEEPHAGSVFAVQTDSEGATLCAFAG
jgi:sugar lactone lactonase YvrE